MGQRLPVRAVEALAQLHPPHLHQHPRQGPRHRLRHPADGRGPEVAPLLPRQPALRVPADGLLRVGRGDARPRGREHRRRQAEDRGEQGAARRDHAQGPPPGAQGLPAVPGADRPAVPADPGRQRHRQPGPQRLGVQHHLLRPLPGRGGDLHRGGVRGRVARPLVLPPAARLGEHHRQPAVPRDDRATCRTRSSTTCSPTCRRAATRRSPRRCATSASATAWSTTPARCSKQLLSVARKICRMALPTRRKPSPEPVVELARAAWPTRQR